MIVEILGVGEGIVVEGERGGEERGIQGVPYMLVGAWAKTGAADRHRPKASRDPTRDPSEPFTLPPSVSALPYL